MGMTFLVVKDNTTYDMTSLVQSVTWSGKKSSAPRTLEITMVDHDGFGYDRPDIEVEKGQTCGFYWNGEELFRGIIMRSSQSNDHKAKYKAYDSAVYLANNTDTFVYKKKTATQILKDICTRFELQCEAVDTEHVIAKVTKPNTTAIDVIWAALARTYKATNKRFYVISQKGVIRLISRADNVVQWVFEEGSNLLSYSRDRSIEEVRTRVKIYSDANKQLAEANDTELEAKIGIMQHSENAESKEKKAQLKTKAQTILDQMKQQEETLSIECMGLVDVYSGVAVYVNVPFLGIQQTFFVDEDTHTFEGEKHTMKLTLNAVNDVEGADNLDNDVK